MRERARQRWRLLLDQRRRLRVRITAAFALGALALAGALAVATYLLAQRYLLDQREASARRQTYTDARLVRDALDGPGGDPAVALRELELPNDRQAAFVLDGTWYGTGAPIDEEQLPRALRETVAAGRPAHQRYDTLGSTLIAVGVPIPAAGGSYFEVFQLQELRQTLDVIRNSLLAASGVTVAAATLLGLWASRRVLRPVLDVSKASARLAAGDLSARLEPQADPDLDRVVDSFNSMATALEERIERDARFASDVSHELRSPLTTLATAADVLAARRDDLSGRSREALDLVVDEIRRFQRMVEGLLELSRNDAGVDPLELGPVQLGELVLHVTTRFASSPFSVSIAPEVASTELLVDKRRLERTLVNLLENATTHGEGIVGVSVLRANGCARIEIDDQGPGLSVDERAHVFERFYRGQRAGRRTADSSTGLGLALVAEHVRLHDGRVWIEDRPEARGARVVVELPWREA